MDAYIRALLGDHAAKFTRRAQERLVADHRVTGHHPLVLDASGRLRGVRLGGGRGACVSVELFERMAKAEIVA